LDNPGLQSLTSIVAFAGFISRCVRLLTSRKALQFKAGAPRLTSAYATAWFAEHQCANGEVRLMATQQEHRRFLLLSGGQSLLLGPSLNSLAKNEAARLEPDTHDRQFFDAAWAQASLLG
jgi:hypothetical protein